LSTSATSTDVVEALLKHLFELFTSATLKKHLPVLPRGLVFDEVESDKLAVFQKNSLLRAALALPGLRDFCIRRENHF
jgi:hypothetical protein